MEVREGTLEVVALERADGSLGVGGAGLPDRVPELVFGQVLVLTSIRLR